MSGLTPRDLLGLEEGDLKLDKGEVEVRGTPPRRVRLGAGVISWFQREGEPWLAWKNLDHFDREELETRLQLAAVDAGLAGSENLDADLLRQTYLLYLVRQGIRLSELEEVAGSMPGRKLLDLGRFSPPHAGRHLSEIDPLYPLFA
jgi:hypothetical protein